MVRVLKAVAMRSHGVRMLGSGVLDLCYVACGRMDAVYSGVAR
jgi:myo-inositol-1(or 4)-monophosphatase